jgi:hypothetical protein
VFLAGAKLLDSVKQPMPAIAMGNHAAPVRRRLVTGRNRPRRQLLRRASESRFSRRTD